MCSVSSRLVQATTQILSDQLRVEALRFSIPQELQLTPEAMLLHQLAECQLQMKNTVTVLLLTGLQSPAQCRELSPVAPSFPSK